MKNKTKMIAIRVDEDLKKKLDIYCATEQKTITELLTNYIKNLVEGENLDEL